MTWIAAHAASEGEMVRLVWVPDSHEWSDKRCSACGLTVADALATWTGRGGVPGCADWLFRRFAYIRLFGAAMNGHPDEAGLVMLALNRHYA